MQFSGAIKLGAGLDDYLAPAQNCVLPMMQGNLGAGSKDTQSKVTMSLSSDIDPLNGLISSFSTQSAPLSEVPGSGFTQMKAGEGNDKAQITLADCLSCSGCVTTAESILIAQHSSAHLLKILNQIYNITTADPTTPTTPPFYDEVVVSLSLPSLLSIASLFDTSCEVMFDLLTIWLSHIGVNRVLFALESQLHVLNTATQEFQQRYRNLAAKHGISLPQTANFTDFIQAVTHPTTTANPQINPTPHHQSFAIASLQSSTLPLLASECPGWVCLSEKTQGEKMIPFMSALRSPQSVLGVFAKGITTMNSSGEDIVYINPRVFHVSIQPCYDKKLEATRECFEFNNNYQTSQVCCQEDGQSDKHDENSSYCQGGTLVAGSSCCQDEGSTKHHVSEKIPFVDLVLSTHELVDMLVDNIQQVEGLEEIQLETTDQPKLLTTPVISQIWMNLWAQYALKKKDQLHLPTSFITKTNQFYDKTILIKEIGTLFPIYRVPGLNTSSGGYAESVLLSSLHKLFNTPANSPQYHNILTQLQWVSVANNDIKAFIVEYLGSGYENGKSDILTGLYAAYGKNATIILPGAILDQNCITATTVPQASTETPVRRVKMASIEDDLFDSVPKCKAIPVTASLPSAQSKPESPQCFCVACNPMFAVNTIKYKQIKNKVLPVGTTAPIIAVDTASKPAKIVKLSGLDDDDFGIPTTRPKPVSPTTSSPASVMGHQQLKQGTVIHSNLPPELLSHFPNLPQFTLTSPLATPTCVLSVSTAFGLRNVQSIIRQQDVTANAKLPAISANKTSSVSNGLYHYVEVMSCPTGCINGGAQLTSTQIKSVRTMMNDKLMKMEYGESSGNQSDISQLPGLLYIKPTKDAQITLQKALLQQIQNTYDALPCHYTTIPHQNDTIITTHGNFIQKYQLPLLFTQFNPIVQNEQLQALRW